MPRDGVLGLSELVPAIRTVDPLDPLDPEGSEVRVLNRLCILRGRDVLEIGAGNGRLTWRYADRAASVVGLEPDEELVERAKAATADTLRDRVDFRHANCATVDLPEAGFDVALFSWSI